VSNPKGWRRDEIYSGAVVFTTATCQGLITPLRRDEIYSRAVVFTTATCPTLRVGDERKFIQELLYTQQQRVPIGLCPCDDKEVYFGVTSFEAPPK